MQKMQAHRRGGEISVGTHPRTIAVAHAGLLARQAAKLDSNTEKRQRRNLRRFDSHENAPIALAFMPVIGAVARGVVADRAADRMVIAASRMSMFSMRQFDRFFRGRRRGAGVRMVPATTQKGVHAENHCG